MAGFDAEQGALFVPVGEPRGGTRRRRWAHWLTLNGRSTVVN